MKARNWLINNCIVRALHGILGEFKIIDWEEFFIRASCKCSYGVYLFIEILTIHHRVNASRSINESNVGVGTAVPWGQVVNDELVRRKFYETLSHIVDDRRRLDCTFD
jgi:hypothetical protein